MIALPSSMEDMYRIHQLVWAYIVPKVQSNLTPSFLYRLDNGLIRVRSRHLPAGRTLFKTLTPQRPIHIDLAAVEGSDHQQPVAEQDLQSWCQRKLEKAGFGVTSLAITGHEVRRGCKYADGRVHKIVIPVARVQASITLKDLQSCNDAWQNGIGRGKRFGLGMITQ